MDMEIGLARMKTDGTVTVPWGMRRLFKKGEQLVVLADQNRVTFKKASDVSSALRHMAGEPSLAHGVRPTAKPPVKVPKRDKFGHFIAAKKAPARKR